MTRAARAAWLLALVCSAACTEDVAGLRTVHLESARALYTEDRPGGGAWDQGISPAPEVEARFLVDGTARGKCSKRWTAFEMVCKLDLDVELGPDARLELVVEDNDGTTAERMGAGTLARAADKLPQRGRATLALTTDGSVTRSSLTLQVQWQPRVPIEVARVLVVILGAAAALLLYGVLRGRFFTVEDRRLRSVAFVSAAVATAAAWLMMVFVLDRAAVLEPLLICAPMGLGAYALAAMIIDGVATGRWGRRRIQVMFAAAAAVIAIPFAMSIALVSPKLIIVAAVIIACVLFM